MTSVKLCRNCVYSRSRENDYELRCFNPLVNGDDAWALSSKLALAGTSCRSERERVWFTPCGRKGKQYVEKCLNGTKLYPHTGGVQPKPTGVGCEGS